MPKGSEAEQIIPIPKEAPEKKLAWEPKIVPGGIKEEGIEEKKEKKPAIAGGGKKKIWPKVVAGVGIPAVLGGGVAAYFIQQEQSQEQKGDYLIQDEKDNPVAVIKTTETKNPEESKPTEEETPVDSALEIVLKGKVSFISEVLPGTELNTKTGELTAKAGNEWGIEEGESIGWYVVGAFKMETADGVEEEQDAIGLSPEAIRKILNENKEKGIFKCPWPFNFQEDKGIKIVELVSKQWNPDWPYITNEIGIKFSEPINLYAPIDCDESKTNELWEKIPDKESDPGFFSAQNWKSLDLFTEFGYKSEEMDEERSAMFKCIFIDWEPLVELKDPVKVKNILYDIDIIGKIKYGDFLGKLLPKTSDFEFIDFNNNSKYYENPGLFQAELSVRGFFDDLPNDSSLEKILRLGKENQEVTVFIWPGNQKTAHEQSN